jgi:transposase
LGFSTSKDSRRPRARSPFTAPAFGSVHRSHGAGTTIHEVGARLGHRSIVATNRYAHLFPARYEAIAEGLGALSRAARKAADALHGAKISNDPHFEDKLVDVVGLYLDPPERAVVFSFDEKTQRQALDRTQPSLPMRPGRGVTLTHDYKRNGTTDLFAAFNVGTGEVIYDCKRRHTAKDVLSFFKLIDLLVPRELDIHVVLDNLSAHKAPEIKTWLAHPKRARWHLHFTPTSSSRLNLVQGWFKLLTERRLRHGVFSSVEALREAIEFWAEHWNDDPKPFVWRKTAEEIIEKVRRGRAALHRVHATPHH